MASKENTTVKRITQWNCRGMKTALPLITEYCHRFQWDALLLNETKLGPNDRISIPPYKIFRCDRQRNRGGGTAILAHPTLHPIKMVGYRTHEGAEEVVVKITIGKKNYLLITWYSAIPNYSKNTIHAFLKQFDLPLILMGDFNAHGRAWGSVRTDRWGAQIEDLLNDNEYTLMNDGSSTYYRAPNYESCLDLTLVTISLADRCTWEVHQEHMASDHFPTCLTVTQGGGVNLPKRRKFQLEVYKKEIQKMELDMVIKNKTTDEAINIILEGIAEATQKANCTNKRDYRSTCDWWYRDCAQMAQ